ncbi:efflux RND transporter permease subunit [Thalassotalea agarivorans]|uniref:Multidrug efflux pump subunit AcrB n=1 Tax=Thalassotalea agarivorans TaxID=349064 RepID=A0A1H9Y6H4_THASX|nr:efflux RND transporter permease subunit [Thalassotalea agarivorans]SES64483.1 Multidrug efflux pump subunit AcrB [Thalassotalea agarivorans]
MSQNEAPLRGIIPWFANNSVAANLLMVFIIVVGLFSYQNINKKMFPEFNPNSIQVRVAHLGASPEEVEESVVLKVEEAIEDINGIKRVTSSAFEGVGVVNIELQSGYSLSEKLDEVQMQVNAITTFPEQTEKPLVTKQEFMSQVMWLSVSGTMDRRARQNMAQQIRDEIMLLPSVNSARVVGKRAYEISIEITEEKLQKYGLTFDQVTQAVRASSIDLPGGTIKTEGGDILLRTDGQAYTGEEFGRIVLKTSMDGTRLLLRDVANIVDGFVESDDFAEFDGLPSTSIMVQSTGDQDDLAIAKEVRQFVERKNTQLPDGAKVTVWGDTSFYLSERLDMMISNMFLGALLVFLVLTLFLRLRIAFWVMLGIPISFLGAFILMPLFGDWAVSINLLSLFAFIMVLGIVVDDAIVIGESAYSEIQRYGHSTDNVIRGTMRVAMPATFGVLTTIAAFAPLLFIDATFAAFFRAIALVVTFCLIFSLVESKWILPAHIAHMKYVPLTKENANAFERFQMSFKKGLDNFIHNVYKPFLRTALVARYNTLAIFFAILLLSIGLIAASFVKVEVFPNVPSDFIQGQVVMVDGSSPTARNRAIEAVNDAAQRIAEQNQHNGQSFIKHSLIFTEGNTSATFLLELVKSEDRVLDAYEIEKLWRDEIGEIPGTREIRFFAGTNVGGGAALEFQLNGKNDDELEAAAADIESQLSSYDGVYDIRNSFSRGNQEIKLNIKPEAEVLGLTLSSLARQVRQAFYGDEAQRIQRGRDELKVMVRYPKDRRLSVTDLEDMWIRTPTGDLVPFYQVADIEIGQGYSTIRRVNQKRSITISADIDSEKVESRIVIGEMNGRYIPEILSNYPSVSYGVEGASKEQADFLRQLGFAALGALFLIYGLIAIPTKSYAQPLVIMSVIPFGIIGAIIGHFIMGKTVNMMSLYGFIALTGVVVNDSLILVDFINKAKDSGQRMIDVVCEAGTMRFRAILLTSLTTFFGILPLYFETSLQAQFIIPMAISLGFGIMFATVITLFLIPSLYMIKEDIANLFRRRKQNKNTQYDQDLIA